MFIYFFSQREISEMRQPISVKFCMVISSKLNFCNANQKFRKAFPQKILGAKNMQKFGPILDNFKVRR